MRIIKDNQRMKYIIGLFVMAAMAAACNGNGSKSPATKDSVMAMEPEEKQYDTSLVANRRDPVCRMPIKAGIYDTAHYNGAVLGFCSSACKDSFLVNPGAYTLVLK
ncbi:YHS domain-containing protein [Chitinophaga arvensicola]|uniref:YHS domain-containing protein n=2 Tax=Chitinophaga arvensicola TaxID=29529 RepID=A0A1I0RI30_9BACT|nr:YHS domain-containing protein [Chitinophaga arvensicola]